MNNQSNEFDPAESLKLIRSMIETTKHSISDHSHFYLLWGWAVFIASLLQFYLKAVAHYPHHYYAWFITPLALIVHFYFLAKSNKSRPVSTYVGEATSYLWLALGFSFIVFSIIFMKIGWQYSYPFYILMYGIGTYVSGSLLKFKPFIIGGISCGVLSCITVYQPFDTQILLLSFAILISYIIPGHMLRFQYRKNTL